MTKSLKEKFEKAVQKKSDLSSRTNDFKNAFLDDVQRSLREDATDYLSLSDVVRTSLPRYSRVEVPLFSTKFDSCEEYIRKKMNTLSGKSLFVYFSHSGTENNLKLLSAFQNSLSQDAIWQNLKFIKDDVGLIIQNEQLKIVVHPSQDKFMQQLLSSFEVLKFDNQFRSLDLTFLKKKTRIEILFQERISSPVRESVVSKEETV